MAEIDEEKRFSPVTDFCRSFICEKVKLVIAACVVNLLVVVVFVGVAKGYCVLQIPAIVNFVLLFLALLLLAYCEALHYAVVSIEKWDMTQVHHYHCYTLSAVNNTPILIIRPLNIPSCLQDTQAR
jgi:hypothetical protein